MIPYQRAVLMVSLAVWAAPLLGQNNCGYISATLTSDVLQGAPYTAACTTNQSANSETVTYSVEGTFIQSGYSSYVYWGPSSNHVTGHGTCLVTLNTGSQANCHPLMTFDMLQTNSPTANSQFDNIAQDRFNSGPVNISCVNGAVRLATSLVPGTECNPVPFGCCVPGVICGDHHVCDESSCACMYITPIVIDTTGRGFRLTSAQQGVVFDILGDGNPVKISWTDATSGNAFLALDRNHNGKIDSGRELFGNVSEQPKSLNPNGFLALAEFDKPENGGNGDGIIDHKDAVFSQLRLWIDENHDGISQPNELHKLPELGVFSLSLNYREDRRTDEYGNEFHYVAAVNPNQIDGKSRDGRWGYDVFLVPDTAGPPNQARKRNCLPKPKGSAVFTLGDTLDRP